MDNLPKHCVGVLVAYSNSITNDTLKRPWNLGVLVYHSANTTLILPATTVRQGLCPTSSTKYGLCDFDDNCIEYTNVASLKLMYLNCIHSQSKAGKDGFIESSVKGPDVLFNTFSFPTKTVFDTYKQVCERDPLFFSIDELNVYHPKKKKMKMFHQKLHVRKELKDTRNICSYGSKKDIVNGFAFPYVNKGNDDNVDHLTFAFLPEKEAKALICQSSITIEKYNEYLDINNINKTKMKVYSIDDRGISIERRDKELSSNEEENITVSELESNIPLLKKKGTQIGYWKKTKTVTIQDVDILKKVLNKTYGNFSFQRSKTKCFGLNSYTGTHYFLHKYPVISYVFLINN